jgi:BirA family biotin operon repressor/biotin-[acetyl-CoA-carboxylase] ligase
LTPTEEKILLALADGAWHSGTDLAHAAGADVARIEQEISALGRTGLRVDRGSAQTYRINGGLDLFYKHMMLKELSPRAQAGVARLDVYWETDSTNERLLAQAAATSIHGHCVLAEFQTAGRGRQGRHWHAPLGSGLCLSLGWRLADSRGPDNALSLAVALGLTRALQRLGARDLALKWPNDVYWQDRKLAGILVERRWRAGGGDAVIGIGLNTAFPAWFSQAEQARWIDLRTVLGRPVSRNALAAAVLEDLCAVLREYAQAGFAPLLEEWCALDGLSGRAVTVLTAAGTVQGRATGINDSGALLVEVEGIQHVFHSAEVSVRLSA